MCPARGERTTRDQWDAAFALAGHHVRRPREPRNCARMAAEQGHPMDQTAPFPDEDTLERLGRLAARAALAWVAEAVDGSEATRAGHT